MKIVKINVYKLNVPFRNALVMPLGTMTGAQNVVVKLESDVGIVGWGEASPFAPITGDTQEVTYRSIAELSPLLLGSDAHSIDNLTAQMRKMLRGSPSARSAIDIALYDMVAKAAAIPLYRYLGGSLRDLFTDVTIGMQESIGETERFASSMHSSGVSAIKLKVGRSGLADVPHVAKVREVVGSQTEIRIDANQGWDYSTAVANLQAVAKFGVLLCEQPINARDWSGLAALRRKVDIPICADESMFDDADAYGLCRLGAADQLNIKLGKAGGIHTALRINAIAEAANLQCMVGCFAETRIGLSASAHFALARRNVVHLNLDSAYELCSDPVRGGVTYDPDRMGRINLPEQPGIGAGLDEDSTDIVDRVTLE